MKIQLTNFCCWESQSFEFPDEGNILISAPSGYGKTSIIRAIQFALFGTGTKVVQFGKRKCEVILEYKEIHIKRTKGPCRLVVNNSIEDDEAQEFIYKHISKSAMFHLEQNQKNTFVYMSPLSKLEYLETIAFEHTNLSEIKSTVKNYIKEHEMKRIELESKLSLTTELMESMDMESAVEIQLPLLLQEYINTYDSIDNAIDAHQSQYSSDMVYLRTLEEDMKQITQYNQLVTTYENKKSQYESQKHVLENKCLEFTESYPEFESTQNCLKNDIFKIEETLRQYDCRKKHEQYTLELRKYKDKFANELKVEYENVQAKLASLCKEEDILPCSKKECTNRLNSLQNSLTKHREYISLLTKYNSSETDSSVSLDTVSEVDTEYSHSIERLRETQHRLKQFETVYTCPSCNTYLQIDSENMLCVDTHMENTVGDKSKMARELETSIREMRIKSKGLKARLHELRTQHYARDALRQQLEEIPVGIRELNECETTEQVQKYEESIDAYIRLNIERNKYLERKKLVEKQCVSVKSKIRELRNICTELDSVVSKESVPETNELLQEKYKSLIQKQEQVKNAFGRYRTYLKHIDDINTNLKELEECYSANIQPYVFSINFTEKNIHTIRSELKEYQDKQFRYANEQSLLHKYAQYRDICTRYSKHQETYEFVQKELKSVSVCVENGNKLKSKIAQAESLAISTLIHTINSTVEEYLDGFFPRNPISIRIVPFKKTKTQLKPQIELEIIYSNTEMGIASLSGGERDRVVLAFMMAFAEMSNSPFLLLDECVSSLDQETANVVFDFIQTKCKSKCTILIAHQIITGIFDNILNLTTYPSI